MFCNRSRIIRLQTGRCWCSGGLGSSNRFATSTRRRFCCVQLVPSFLEIRKAVKTAVTSERKCRYKPLHTPFAIGLDSTVTPQWGTYTCSLVEKTTFSSSPEFLRRKCSGSLPFPLCLPSTQVWRKEQARSTASCLAVPTFVFKYMMQRQFFFF